MLVVLPVCEAGSSEGRMCANWVRARARKRKRWWLGSRARARTQTDVAVVPSVLVDAPRWEVVLLLLLFWLVLCVGKVARLCC